MDNFLAPLITLALFVLLFGVLPTSLARKAAARKKGGQAGPKATQAASQQKQPAPEAAPRPLQEGTSRWEHDHTSWKGSLNFESTEGQDPCHEEQLSSLAAPAEGILPEPREIPGLTLRWTGDEIVRGLVVSEVLKRKTFPR